MSEETQLRTRAEINQEYTNCAAQLGDCYMKLELQESERVAFSEKIFELKKQMQKLIKEPAAPPVLDPSKADGVMS